jgi:hypothetical protein
MHERVDEPVLRPLRARERALQQLRKRVVDKLAPVARRHALIRVERQLCDVARQERNDGPQRRL